ncbi:CAM rad domain-containing protein [Cyclospora cayetanensis]|uniref:CAM rad domain-containing protein n=1 Tax=Cyclospora cayetanensis TaxID=88456 RepID=A0A1D3D491_9EIME|nr:CAM rad domain-containing protein [Cyclospora cayetanensis]
MHPHACALLPEGRHFSLWTKRYFVLKERVLYSFRSLSHESSTSTILLRDCFVSAHKTPTLRGLRASNKPGAVLFGFSIKANDNKLIKTLYAETAEDRQRWLEALKQQNSAPSFHDAFSLVGGPPLGVGRFGSVRLAIERKTQQKVAVKIGCSTHGVADPLSLG